MNDFALLDKLKHLRGLDTAELAMMAGIVARSETPTAEALIMRLSETINELRAEVRSLKPIPNMKRMR
ncbi:TPA: hypothetical protein NVL79_005960 [Pseudomonas aeruginosa]|nr:hypothetical protein [Pseudomonas aeruginosa]